MWQVDRHMASSNNFIIRVHPNTTPLNPNAPVFQPLPPCSSYHYPFERTPFYYCPQRWTWTYATLSAFPQNLYQYQQPRILSQNHWPYYFQVHDHHHHTTNEEDTTVMSKKNEEEHTVVISNEKRGLYWGRKRVIGPRLMKKPKGGIISEGSSTSINRDKRSSFYVKRWIPKQHLCDDQKGNVGPENSNTNADIVPESSETEFIEAGCIKCNDVCGPEADNNNKTLHCGKTTVMIRNVPNQFGRRHLLKILDEHCRSENMKIKSNSGIDSCWSDYDFVYLPIDYRRGLNKGYAFVNFTTNTAAVRFWQAFDQFKWEYYQFENSKFRSRKICQICWAKYQGKEALRDNFQARVFPDDEYRPVTLEPPSDGRGTTTSQRVLIGYKRNKKMRLEPAVDSVS